MKNILRGDSVARSKIYRVVLTNFSAGTKLTATIGNKRIAYEAQSSEDAADGMATLINASAHSEFRELLAEAAGNVLTISARTPGMDVFIDFSTQGSVSGAITVTRTTAGHETVNEVQKIKLSDGTTGGTWTYTNNFGTGDELTGNINWGASGADVKSAIVALATPTTADLDVVKISDTEWDLYWKGAFAAVEVAEGTIDGTNLTGAGSAVLERTKIGRGLSNEVQGFQFRALGDDWSIMISADGVLFQQWSGTGLPSAAQFEAFLETIPSIGAGNVKVYGGGIRGQANRPFFVIVFTGSLAGINVPLMQVSFGEGTSNINNSATSFSTISQGGQATTNEILVLDLGGAIGSASGVEGSTGELRYQGNVVSFDGEASATEIESAFESLGFDEVTAHVGSVNNVGVYAVEFKGAEADTDIDPIDFNGSALLGTSRTPTLSEARKGEASVNETWKLVINGTGGTFELGDGTDTSPLLAWNIAAATLKTEIETDLGKYPGVTVTGTGTPADPFIITVTNPAATNVNLLTANGANLTGGTGTVTETVAHHAGANEVQTITLAASVTGGLWDGELTDIPFGPYGIAEPAAVIEGEFESILGVGNITVAGAAGGPYTVTYLGAYANTPMPLLTVDGTDLIVGAGSELISIEVTQKSRGPNHANDGDNFSLARPPETGDDFYYEDGNTDLLYGMDWIRTFTVDAANERLTIVDHDFADGQKVTVRNSEVVPDPPAGLTHGNDYYVIDLGKDHIQLSATRGGAPIDITDAGTGTHTIAVELNSFHVGSRWIGGYGLPKRNNTGQTEYVEHRNRKFRVGLLASGDKKVTIGHGEGNGSGRMVLDTGDYEIDLVIYRTGSPRDEGTPSFQHTGENANSLVTVYDGENGFAFFAGEVAQYRKIIHAEGLVNFGEGQVTGEYLKTGGEVLSAGAVFNGPLTILG